MDLNQCSHRLKRYLSLVSQLNLKFITTFSIGKRSITQLKTGPLFNDVKIDAPQFSVITYIIDSI